MTKQEMIERLTAIGTATDPAGQRDLINKLQIDLEKDYDKIGDLEKEKKDLTDSKSKLESDMEDLRKYNMSLFVQVAQQTKDHDNTGGSGTIKETDNELTIDSLFDKEGRLK